MSEETFDPFEGYNPQKLNFEDIKELGFSDEMTEELIEKIREDLKASSKVVDVLKVLAPLGEFAIKMALKSASSGLA